MTTVGIVGCGFVGKAVSQLNNLYKTNIYDKYHDGLSSKKNEDDAYNSDFVFICVPTPQSESGELNIDIVVECVKRFKERVDDSGTLIIKSTIPPGTITKLSEEHNITRVVHNPEFLTERTAMEDFWNADEIIVGGPDTVTNSRVLSLYKTWFDFIDAGTPVEFVQERVFNNVSAEMAEMIKVVRNSFYSVKVEFMNEVADLCEAMQINYDDFRKLFARSGKHAWVNPQHTFVPGPDGKKGFGGKCLPKDSSGLLSLGEKYGVGMPALKATVLANKSRRGDHK